ncbi:hypothetical protein EMCRGX_G003027 [Ephydatia muelleri]
MTDLFTCQAYVQKGENDICDDGKEIAEAEDWESTVKENRHPGLLPKGMGSIGAILLRYQLQEQGEPSLPVFIRQRVSENRVGIALQAVHPDYHRMRLNGASRSLNPQPYQAAYFGEKLHIDQNEKLVMSHWLTCGTVFRSRRTDKGHQQCSFRKSVVLWPYTPDVSIATGVKKRLRVRLFTSVWKCHNIPGKGIPNERMANARTRRLPSEIIPDAHFATSQFVDMGGHLTLESHFGNDPLAGRNGLIAERNRQFHQ